jgi:hypothetical protein
MRYFPGDTSIYISTIVTGKTANPSYHFDRFSQDHTYTASSPMFASPMQDFVACMTVIVTYIPSVQLAYPWMPVRTPGFYMY